MASIVCHSCGCAEIDVDAARGDSVCTNCGAVLSENVIVAEVEFQETGRGGHSVIGQYVGPDSAGKGCVAGIVGVHSRESREITLQTGKRRIVELASQLRLNQHCVDMAFSYFRIAVARGLTQGRRSSLVVAACLYITCRLEGTPHLLLDFCDVLQVNIYDLGKAFGFLSRSLYITLPPTDPCLYVMRFAQSLNFGKKEHDVSMTAMRLVQRMKRDWIGIGRRPTGLCGAALLLAARYHNFNRTIADVVQVVNIGESVVRKRLLEFEQTASSSLTLDEFQSVDLEEAADPPAYTEARRKARQQQLEAEGQKLDVLKNDLLEAERMVEAALEEKRRKARIRGSASLRATEGLLDAAESEEKTAEAFLEDVILRQVLEVEEMGFSTDAGSSAGGDELVEEMLRPLPSTPAYLRVMGPTLESLGITRANVVPTGESSTSAGFDTTLSASERGDSARTDDGELDLEGIDDTELDAFLLSDAEAAEKTKYWMAQNGKFLEEREQRRRQQEVEEAEKREKEGLTGGPAPKKRRRQRKNLPPASTASEAIAQIVKSRKLSAKINYEVLKTLGVHVAASSSGESLPTAAVAAPVVHNDGAEAGGRSATASRPGTAKTRKQAAVEERVDTESSAASSPSSSIFARKTVGFSFVKPSRAAPAPPEESVADLLRKHQSEVYGDRDIDD